jgi:hypothetical protein
VRHTPACLRIVLVRGTVGQITLRHGLDVTYSQQVTRVGKLVSRKYANGRKYTSEPVNANDGSSPWLQYTSKGIGMQMAKAAHACVEQRRCNAVHLIGGPSINGVADRLFAGDNLDY